MFTTVVLCIIRLKPGSAVVAQVPDLGGVVDRLDPDLPVRVHHRGEALAVGRGVERIAEWVKKIKT